MTTTASTEVIKEVFNNTPYWLDFFSSIVNSLSWPVAITFIVFIMKKPIGNLISKLTNLNKLSAKGIEIEFIQQSLDKVETNIFSEVNQTGKTKSTSLSNLIGHNFDKGQDIDLYMIKEVWEDLILTINHYAMMLNIFEVDGNDYDQSLKYLLSNDIIGVQTLSNIKELESLKNELLNSRRKDINYQVVKSFGNSVKAIKLLIESNMKDYKKTHSTQENP